jgi:hypothetical protein
LYLAAKDETREEAAEDVEGMTESGNTEDGAAREKEEEAESTEAESRLIAAAVG